MFVHRQVFHESWKGAVTSCRTKNNYFLCKAVHKVVSLGFFTLLFKCWYIQNYASWAPFNFLFINPNRKEGIHHTFPWQTPKSTFCFYTFHIHGTRDHMGSRDQVIKKKSLWHDMSVITLEWSLSAQIHCVLTTGTWRCSNEDSRAFSSACVLLHHGTSCTDSQLSFYATSFCHRTLFFSTFGFLRQGFCLAPAAPEFVL